MKERGTFMGKNKNIPNYSRDPEFAPKNNTVPVETEEEPVSKTKSSKK